MGTITGQAIVDRAWIKSLDDGGPGTRWPTAEALKWVNDAQRAIVNMLPKSYTKSAAAALLAGTRQTLAGLSVTDGLMVVDVVRNVATGKAITKRDRAWIDDARPLWHADVGTTVDHWFFDERDPKTFYVYPAAAGVQVEVVYWAVPADLASLANAITLDDIYANAIQFFVLFSFYSKDAGIAGMAQRAAANWSLFERSLGFFDRSVLADNAKGNAASAGAT